MPRHDLQELARSIWVGNELLSYVTITDAVGLLTEIRELEAEIGRLKDRIDEEIVNSLPLIAGRVWTHEVSTCEAAKAAKGVSDASQ